MDWQGALLIELLLAPIVLVALLPFLKNDESVTARELRAGARSRIIWAAALAQALGILALNVGLSVAPDSATVVIAVSSCYPVLTIWLAMRHMQERIPLVPLLGGLAGVTGVVLLSLG
jgi:drug/metabolite transporter (DMT)-like permease